MPFQPWQAEEVSASMAASNRAMTDSPEPCEPCAAALFGYRAALWTLAGIVLSGPAGLAVVETFAPQPDWRGAALFAQHYDTIQLLPYVCGFMLIGGAASMVVALCWAAPPELRGRSWLALVLTAAFTTFILLNYVIQTTIVPSLVAQRTPVADAFLEVFAMANPRSFAWALEMWGYAFLSVALWLVADAMSATKLERVVRSLIVVNVVMSVFGAVATAASPAWVFSAPGLISFGAWNALMIVLALCSAKAWRVRLRLASDA